MQGNLTLSIDGVPYALLMMQPPGNAGIAADLGRRVVVVSPFATGETLATAIEQIRQTVAHQIEVVTPRRREVIDRIF